jgi:hypothetical protein
MPTNTEILDVAPIAGYLSGNAKDKSVLFPSFGRLNPILPQQIYSLYFVLKKIYDLDPNYYGLTPCCEYLWEIMGRYGIEAQGISGGGGVAPSPTPIQQYPIYITQANFTTATFYPNTNLFGNQIAVFLNQINRYLLPNTEFTYDITGLTITLGGFDATQFSYELVIERVN